MVKKRKMSVDLICAELAYLLPILGHELPIKPDKKKAWTPGKQQLLLSSAHQFCAGLPPEPGSDEASMAHYLRWSEGMGRDTSRSMLRELVRTLPKEEQVMLIRFLMKQLAEPSE